MIQKIRIQNFKSIRDVTVEFSPVTVLVGRSGTGKSNFVLALRFLRDTLIGGQRAQQLQQHWASTRPIPQTEEPTSFDVQFAVPGVDGLFRYQLSLGVQGPQGPPASETLKLGSEVLFSQHSEGPRGFGSGAFGWDVEPSLVQVPQPGPIALGRIPSIANVVIAYTALTEGVGCYTFPNSLMQASPNQSRPSNEASGLDDIGGNYLVVMKDIISDLRDLASRKNIVEALRRVNSGVASIELNDLRQPTHAVVGHQFNDLTLSVDLSQESEGFRRFYAHLLALYQRPPKQLLLFEHPEDGVHPGALSLLAEEFQETPEANRGQVVLTTHSPGLLDRFSEDQIRVVDRQNFETRIGPVSTEQKEAIREELLDPGELLTVDPARLDEVAAE